MIEQYITMRDGHQIFTRVLKQQQANGHIHIVHGMAEHSARYVPFAQMLYAAGYNVSMHDTRGHGRTAEANGLLGHLADDNGAQLVVDDVYEVIQSIATTSNVWLFGHSMGSFIARRYTQLYSDTLAGAIYCATGEGTALHAAGSALAQLFGRAQGGRTPSTLLNAINQRMFNQAFQPTSTAFDWLSTDAEQVQRYIDDPLCGFCPTHQFYQDLLTLMLQSDAQHFTTVRADFPILLLAGREDPVGAQANGVARVAQSLQQQGLQHVMLYIFEGMRHELLNETNKQHVYHVVKWWLTKYEQQL